jgi:hypothetical protein
MSNPLSDACLHLPQSPSESTSRPALRASSSCSSPASISRGRTGRSKRDDPRASRVLRRRRLRTDSDTLCRSSLSGLHYHLRVWIPVSSFTSSLPQQCISCRPVLPVLLLLFCSQLPCHVGHVHSARTHPAKLRPPHCRGMQKMLSSSKRPPTPAKHNRNAV